MTNQRIEPSIQQITYFLNPKTVAVVGASSRPTRIGYEVLKSLSTAFKGHIFPVNPTRESILGFKAYPSVESIPADVELVIVIISIKNIPSIINQAAEKGTKAIVIVSGGGKELGGEYADIESQILEKGKNHQIRILGPNCIGIYQPDSGVDTLFQSHDRLERPSEGPVSYCVQSGTYGAAFLEYVAAKEIGIRSFFSYGNRVDVDEGDLIEYFAEDPNTKVMGFYIEALSDGRKLVNRAKNVVNRKPIVIYKAGKTVQGAKAALSHTGWLSKSPQVNEGILRQAGIILAKNFQHQCAMINALVRQPPARGANIAFVSNGIGPCVGAIDLIQENPLQLAELRPESIEEMEKAYPFYYIPQNPVDVTGSATSRDYKIAIQVLTQDPNVDIIMPYFVFQDTPLDEGIVQVLENATHIGKPILACAIGGPYTIRMSTQIEKKGIPVFSTVDEWVAAAEALYLHGKNSNIKLQRVVPQ